MDTFMLTPKQQRFCDEYLIDLNATQAALRAGYSGSTALNGQLMNIPKIRLYLQQRTGAVARKAQCNHQMVLGELMKIAFGNMGNYFRDDGTMKSMHELTADEKAGLWSVTVTDGDRVTTRIRMNNKMAALEKIAKHLKFYDAEVVQPEKEFVYVNKEQLDNYDRFDDELFNDYDTEEEFCDDWDDEYYPWDTECQVAVAQARAACKARHAAKRATAADEGENREARKPASAEEEEFKDGGDGHLNTGPLAKLLPAPEYLTDEATAVLMMPECPPLAEGWLTAKKLPPGADPAPYNNAWREKLRQASIVLPVWPKLPADATRLGF